MQEPSETVLDRSDKNSRDPVCGMNVSAASVKATVEHNGATYYFCCTRCADKFRAEPDRYLRSTAPDFPRPSPAA